jgi:hypothetical protein
MSGRLQRSRKDVAREESILLIGDRRPLPGVVISDCRIASLEGRVRKGALKESGVSVL